MLIGQLYVLLGGTLWIFMLLKERKKSHLYLYVPFVRDIFYSILSLRYDCALRGACRARHMSVCGGPLLMGGMTLRWGWDLVCSANIPSR